MLAIFLGLIHSFISFLKQLLRIGYVFSVYYAHADRDRRKSVPGVFKLFVDLLDLGFDQPAMHSG